MKKIVSILVFISLLVAAVPTMAAGPDVFDKPQPDGKGFSNNVYVVQLADAPVVAYTGDIAGYPATKPAPGQKINVLDSKVIKYVGYLDEQHDKALKVVGATKKLYDYRYTYNGFAAEMTEAQAEALKTTAGVLVSAKMNWCTMIPRRPRISRVEAIPMVSGQKRKVKMSSSVSSIPVSGPRASASPTAPVLGPNDQIGKLGYRQIPGWNGKCVPGEMFTAANCNQKLIGAQYFNAGYGGDAGIDANCPGNSTRRAIITVTARTPLPLPAVTKACAVTGPGSRIWLDQRYCPACPNFHVQSPVAHRSMEPAVVSPPILVAAIDQAVADGVDVINYSISGIANQFRWIRSKWHSCMPQMPVFLWRLPLATVDPPLPLWRIPARGLRLLQPERITAAVQAR